MEKLGFSLDCSTLVSTQLCDWNRSTITLNLCLVWKGISYLLVLKLSDTVAHDMNVLFKVMKDSQNLATLRTRHLTVIVMITHV